MLINNYCFIVNSIGGSYTKNSNLRVSNGTLIIEPDFNELTDKSFVCQTVESKIGWNKGLFKMRFMLPLNDNYVWSTIYFVGPKVFIDFISQIPEEKSSHDIKTGVVLHEKPNRIKPEKHRPINNMTQTFNEMSMEWDNHKIIWKLNNQLINKVDLKKFSSGDQNIEQIFNENFRLIMAITLRKEFYYSSNFNLKSLHKPYLYVDYIIVYKWNQTENNKQNNTELLNDRRNTIIPFTIPVALAIFVVILIIIAFVYRNLKMNRKINFRTHYVVYDHSELIDEQSEIN